MKTILKPSNGLKHILGTTLPKIKHKPLETILQNASKPHQPTAFKNLLRLRKWFVESQPTAFKKIICKIITYCV